MKTVDQIVEDTISYSDGAYSIEYGEDYEKLTADEQKEVRDTVTTVIDDCGCCGWVWRKEDMEMSDEIDEPVCWSCKRDEEDRHQEELDAEEDERNAECEECGCTYEYLEMNVIDGDYICVNCEEEETL